MPEEKDPQRESLEAFGLEGFPKRNSSPNPSEGEDQEPDHTTDKPELTDEDLRYIGPVRPDFSIEKIAENHQDDNHAKND